MFAKAKVVYESASLQKLHEGYSNLTAEDVYVQHASSGTLGYVKHIWLGPLLLQKASERFWDFLGARLA